MSGDVKNDVFVGNLTFNTTEEQLRDLFGFIGPVKNIRMQTDKETGKPKGFAFVEYFDTNAALSAIKHLDQTELNGRKIKVGYPSNSTLKDIARQLGQLGPGEGGGGDNNFPNLPLGLGVSTGLNAFPTPQQMAHRQQIEAQVVNSLKLHEAWEILDALKKMANDENQIGTLKALLEHYPQLVSATYELEKRLGIVLPAHILQQQQQQQQQTQQTAQQQYQQQQQLSSNNNNTNLDTQPQQQQTNVTSSSSSSRPISHRGGGGGMGIYGPGGNGGGGGDLYGNEGVGGGYQPMEAAYGNVDPYGPGMPEGGGDYGGYHDPNYNPYQPPPSSTSLGGGGGGRRSTRFSAGEQQQQQGGGGGGGVMSYYDQYGNEIFLQGDGYDDGRGNY